MKNILVISASFRTNGNSNLLAQSFIKGALEAGNNVESVSLFGKKIGFCQGCLACQTLGKCVIADDAVEIAQKMKSADVIVFATPIYYYSISGQLKTMLDRANPLYGSDYNFRQIYLLATAAEDEENTVDGALTAIQGWVDCFEKAVFSGVVFAGGVNDVGDIKGHKALESAYSLAKSIS